MNNYASVHSLFYFCIVSDKGGRLMKRVAWHQTEAHGDARHSGRVKWNPDSKRINYSSTCISPLFLCTSITLSMARGYSLHIHIVWRLLQPPNTFSWTCSKLREYTQSSQEIVMAWNILEKKNTRVTGYDSKILPAVIHSKRSGFRPLAENSGAWQASDTCSLTFCNETLDVEAKKEAFSLITNAVNFIQLWVKKQQPTTTKLQKPSLEVPFKHAQNHTSDQIKS